MAKKKRKKEKEKFEYSNEIIGVLFVLLAIIGMLGYGVAGNFIRSFAVFLVGVAYFPLLVVFFCCYFSKLFFIKLSQILCLLHKKIVV